MILALAVIGAVLFGLIGRVAYLQTNEADDLRSAAADQWTRSVTIPAQRGTVFDRHGAELAMSVPAVTVSINPKLIDNGPATVQILDDLLELTDDEVAELVAEVATKDRGFVFVRRQADADIGDQIAAMKLPGVNVDRESRREMPGGDTGRSVIGRANIDGVGISGLELQFDDLLTGTGGQMRREVAPGGRSIPGSETVTAQPVAGDDLVLTLDRSIQYSTEQVLLEQVAAIGAKGATAIAMDTDTGEIYSMASVRRDDETGAYGVTSGNFAAVDAYEPGSVAKVITIASSLSEGLVTPETSYVVPWRKQYYDDLLKDSHQHPDEVMSVARILTESSNIGTIFVQQEMGRERHREFMAAFGLGSKTALDFPGESPGILKQPEDLWGSERVTVAYGQGVSSTSLQLVAAINTIANRGTYVAPKLVKATVGPDGTVVETEPSEAREVVTERAAVQTTEMMRNVVCSGTATLAQVDGLSIAGKTGTAFKAADNGTYFDADGNRIYYSSFVGFFPSENPQVTVLVSVDEPPAGTNDRFGGTAAAPVFAELAPTLIHELGIVPTPGATGCQTP
ncbi:MAG TPA: penicillin-binding protein 2 [Ilumatobacteraceae bacterium]|nr:penicillin-binding protein 2 [Ilumatobacteraceae bacterium]